MESSWGRMIQGGKNQKPAANSQKWQNHFYQNNLPVIQEQTAGKADF
jgi:hypothetical protein